MFSKNILLKSIIIFISFYIIFQVGNKTYATNTELYKIGSTVNVDILSDDFVDAFDPKKDGGDVIAEPFINVVVPIVNNILNIVQIIGAVIFVLSLAAAGLNGIIASDSGVAEDLNLSVGTTVNEYGAKLDNVAQVLNKKTLEKIIRRITIGSVFLMLSTTIVKIVFNVISNI